MGARVVDIAAAAPIRVLAIPAFRITCRPALA